MVEIFTVGGGEYIVNVLNAVAAWTGAGGYKSLIQVALVMGMVLAVIVVAFNQDWRAWLNWFLGATLIYMCLTGILVVGFRMLERRIPQKGV